MEQLKSLLEEISKLEKRAQSDIPNNNGTTVQGHLARKRSAQLRVPELKREYKNSIIKHIVPIFVAGKDSQEFLKAANTSIGVITVDGEGLYKDLVSRMPEESYGGRMSTKVIVDILSRHFADVAVESDVTSYPTMVHKTKGSFAVKSKSDLEEFIKHTVNTTVGAEFAFIYNLKEIADKAIQIEFSSKFLPVLISVSDESLVDVLMESSASYAGSSYLLTAGEVSSNLSDKALAAVKSVDEDSVSNALKSVRSMLKKTKGA